MQYVGIDISKRVFDVAILAEQQYSIHQFPNNPTGFNALIDRLDINKQNTLFCLEATGIYSLALAQFLYQHQLSVLLVNPIKTHAFAKMEMARNKTDKADAKLIARYCAHLSQTNAIDKHRFIPKLEQFEQLQAFITRLEQISKSKTQEINRLEGATDKRVKKWIKQTLAHLERQQLNIETQLQSLINDQESLAEQVKLLTSINGIANKSAWAILAYLGDIRLFTNAKQVASYAGMNPRQENSGSSINRSRLSKMGHGRLRRALYMPALSAAQHNPVLRDTYQRLIANGKPKKVALCAVMRKLLVLAYGVLKSGKPFDVNYVR